MKWIEVIVLTGHEAVEALSELMNRLGATGVVIEDPNDLIQTREDRYGEIYSLLPSDYPTDGVRVTGYYSLQSDSSTLIEDLKKGLDDMKSYGLDTEPGTIHANEVDEEDWAHAWKVHYKPVRISERLTIKPTWEEYTASHGEEVIELDPGMAFGTGTHPTTILCMQLLESYLSTGDAVADVGCGTGILSIACAKLGAGRVLALDLDPVAVTVTKENLQINGVVDTVTAQEADLLSGVEGPFDLIVSNILAHIIIRFIPDAVKIIRPAGVLIVSGIIDDKAEQVATALTRHGFEILERRDEQEWVAFVAKSHGQ